MRKGAVITLCSLMLLAAMTAAAPAPTKQDVARKHIAAMVDVLSNRLVAEQSREPGRQALGPEGEPCVDVELELPDTVWAEGPDGWREHAQGYFELTNCGDEAAEIALGFEITITIDNIIDTVVIIGDLSIRLGAGETIAEEFTFPVPPFDAMYSVCVTATDEPASDTACETMVVVGSGFPGIPVEMAGYLEQGSDCLYFVPDVGVPEARFVLENYGDFVDGDHVLVNGLLVYDCETECTEATGCILDNSIVLYGGPPPGFPFEACGLLVQGEDCVLFAPHNDMYSLVVLDNYGGFGVGDTVYVEGLLELHCETDCTGAIGCLRDNIIDTCTNTAPEIPVEGCGVLVQTSNDCVLFRPLHPQPHLDGDHLFELDNYGDFGVGDSVFVSGLLDIDCVPDCADADACITENMIDFCHPGPPPEWPIEGCGVLVQGTECVLLQMVNLPDSLGGLFVVENLGSFMVGDTVFVAGMIVPDCPSICMEGDGCIIDNVIEPCQPGPPPETPFAGCGVLSEGTDCILFTPALWNDPHGGWTERFVLDNYGEFVPGDSVYVEGLLTFDCDPGCPEAIGCIVENTVDVCGDTPPPPAPIEGCGVLMQGTGCIYIHFGGNMPPADQNFVLDTLGGFGVGDTVFVSGLVDVECDPGCPEAIACIDVDFIGPCETPPPPDYIATCGVLAHDSACAQPVFAAVWNGYSARFDLDEFGGFVEGDSVFVAGYLDLECQTTCPTAMGCIAVDTIDVCNDTPPPPPDDTIAYDGCGVLMMSPYDSCLVYIGATGEHPGIYTLDDYGAFGPGDSVCVTGDLVPGVDSTCPDAFGHVHDNSITSFGMLTSSSKKLRLRNYPNPFNPVTTIAFELPKASHVKVAVYNLLGQEVSTLVDDHLSAGHHEVEWNGMSDKGQRVSSGVYFYRFETDNYNETRKMLLMK